MTEYEEIIIDWTEKQNVENIKEIEGNILYKIYGNHQIYGRDVLLYIGISKNNITRLKQHLNGVFGYVHNLSISFGTINKDFESSKFEVPESILIANHKPAFNKEYIHTIDPQAKNKIIIINNGYHGMLKPCCTNFWWVNDK